MIVDFSVFGILNRYAAAVRNRGLPQEKPQSPLGFAFVARLNQHGAILPGAVGADVLAEPAVVLVAVPALHRFDVPAVFLIEVVGKDVAGGIKVVQLCRPFIPPGDRNDFGMNLEGIQPRRLCHWRNADRTYS